MGATTLKSVISELIGTYVLTVTVGCVGSEASLWTPLAAGTALMLMIYAFGSVSGAHLNPAVTMGVWLLGLPGMDALKACVFVAAQVLGSILGAFSASYLTLGSKVLLGPGYGFSYGGVFVAESVYTAMLVLVVLRAAVSASNPPENEYFGLAIGFVVVAAGYAVGHISGGVFNPALTIAFSIVSVQSGWWWLAYIGSQLAGAGVAVLLNLVLEDTSKVPNALRWFVAETVGTFFLVFTVGCNVMLGSKAPALSIGASLLCMVYALGSVSGAHLNPAVTVSLMAAGKFPSALTRTERLEELASYFGGQVAGAVIGAVSYTLLCGRAFPLQPGPEYLWGHAAVVEMLYTFMLAFVVLNVATLSGNRVLCAGGKAKTVHGLAVGFVVVAGGCAAGPVSGGALNPAVSLAVDLANAYHGAVFMNAVAYSAFQLLGGLLAAGVFVIVRDDEYRKGPAVTE